MTNNNLTYLQEVALRGEIGFALSTSAHDAEIKFRIYLILKEVEDKLKPFIVECVKEATTFDESTIDRIYLEVINNKVPVWLWVDEVISDIKLHLSIANSGYAGIADSRLSINKTQERKNLLESAFVFFAREALMLSPDAAEQLFDEILNDPDLSFLYKACFYLKSCCPEVRDIKGAKAEEVPEELMSCVFNPKNLLSFRVETKALAELNRASQKERRRSRKNSSMNEVEQEGFVLNHDAFSEEFSRFISEKIDEIFEGHSNSSSKGEPTDTVYVVKKVFTDSGLSTEIRTCQTEKEALDFVKTVIREYPELANVCEFKVCLERKHEKEKNRWKPKT